MKIAAEPGNVELREIDEPQVKDGQVKIKVEYAGICGTDIKIQKGEAWSNPPVVLGHEFSGVVCEIGEGVTGVKPGDRVVSETAQIICGKCGHCINGTYLMCPSRLSIGYGTHGAFTSYIVVREAIVHKIPDGVGLDEAALCEPSAVAVHAVLDSVSLLPADVVVVMGPGAIGLLVAQVVKACGASCVITGVGSDVERLKVARGLGIDYVINSQDIDIVTKIKEMTGGKGADYVIDCSGSGAAINDGIYMLKRRGTMVQVGLTRPMLEIPYASLANNEQIIRGTFGHRWDNWEQSLKLLEQKKVKTKPLITDVFSIDEWEKAFDKAERQEGIKILFKL